MIETKMCLIDHHSTSTVSVSNYLCLILWIVTEVKFLEFELKAILRLEVEFKI